MFYIWFYSTKFYPEVLCHQQTTTIKIVTAWLVISVLSLLLPFSRSLYSISKNHIRYCLLKETLWITKNDLHKYKILQISPFSQILSDSHKKRRYIVFIMKMNYFCTTHEYKPLKFSLPALLFVLELNCLPVPSSFSSLLPSLFFPSSWRLVLVLIFRIKFKRLGNCSNAQLYSFWNYNYTQQKVIIIT